MNNDLSRGKVLQTVIQPVRQPDKQEIKAMGIKQNKHVIERGASWSTSETRILLSLWGEDLVQRQLTNSKRTRQVWETIAQVLAKHGYIRKAEQCRTRIFNMIAEYRRILKNPTQDRVRKCTYFEAIHKIFQARDKHQIREILDCEEDFNYDLNKQQSVNSHEFDEADEADLVNSELHSELDDKEVFSYSMSPSHFHNSNLTSSNSFNPFNNNLTKLSTQLHNGINHTILSANQLNGIHNQTKPANYLNQVNDLSDPGLNASSNSNQTLINQALVLHQLQQQIGLQDDFQNSRPNSQTYSLNDDHSLDAFSYQNSTDQLTVNGNRKRSKSMDDGLQSINKKRRLCDGNDLNEMNIDLLNLDNSHSNITLILFNKLFNHLAKNNETMREWAKLEEKRIENEMASRKEEKERDERRQQKFFDIVIKFQKQMFDFLAVYDPNLVEEAKKLNLVEKIKEEFNLEFNSQLNEKIDLNNNLTSEKEGGTEKEIEPEFIELDQQTPQNQLEILKPTLVNQEPSSLNLIETENNQLDDENLIANDLVQIETNEQSAIDQNNKSINQPRLIKSSLLDTSKYISLLSNQSEPVTTDIEYIIEEIVSNDYETTKNGHNDYTFSNGNIQHEEIVN